MNFETSKFCYKTYRVASYDHHESIPKHHYVRTNPNFVGFQKSEISNLPLLSINML
jgi:hypothetical protein